MGFKRYTGEDGRRIEETVREVVSADAVERVQEVHEEVIPMKLTKKITTKMVSVPVEERTEVFSPDGTVQTSVKSVANEALSLEDRSVAKQEVGMGDVLAAFKGLHNEIAHLKADLHARNVEVETEPEPDMPVIIVDRKPAPKVDEDVKVEPVIVVDKPAIPAPPVVVDKTVVEVGQPLAEKILAGGAWGVVAVLAAYLVYQWLPMFS